MRWLTGQVLAGLRARAGAALLLAGLAAIVAVVAAATPVLLRAVQQSASDDTLAATPALDRSLVGDASSNESVDPAEVPALAAAVPAVIGRSSIWSAPRVHVEENDDPVTWLQPELRPARPQQFLASIASCADLRIVAGRCATASGEALLPASTAKRTGTGPGARIEIGSASLTATVEVVGVYDATTPSGRIAGQPQALVGNRNRSSDPDLLVTADQLAAYRVPVTAYAIRTLRTHVPLDRLPSVRAALARGRAVPLTDAGAAATTNAVTRLDGVLDRIAQQRAVASTVLDVVAVGAFGLAWAAFAALALRIGRIRSAEWALPRLRGLPRRRRLAARLVEPIVALVIGTAIGTAVALAACARLVDASTRAALGDVAPQAIGEAALALGGGVAALVLTAVAADRRPLDGALRPAVEPRELPRLALVGQAVIVVAALAAVAALALQSGTGLEGAGLLAPGLLALAAGFVLLQVALAVVRRRTRVPPWSLGALIVWRRLGRSPSQLTASVLLGAAVALAVFVSVTSGTADALADATAAARAGAPTVLHVRTPAGVTVVEAVHRADPAGRSAVAAEELPDGSGDQRVVAVDVAHLAAVSSWRPAWSGLDAAALRRALAPPVLPSLRLRGSRLALQVQEPVEGDVPSGDQRFEMIAQVQNDRSITGAELGPFALDGVSRTLSADVPCTRGCRLVALQMRSVEQYPNIWSARLRLTAISTDVQSASVFRPALETPGTWIQELGHDFDASAPRAVSARSGPEGLDLQLRDDVGGGSPGARVRDTVEPLPAVLGATTRPDPLPGAPGVLLGAAADGTPLVERAVSRSSALPRLLGDGILVDLPRMLPQTDLASARPDQEVWIGRNAAAVERRLRAEGVRIVRTETLTAAVAAHRAEAAPVSARFAIVGAVGAVTVVLLALLGARLLSAPGRRREHRSFAAAGVPAGRLRRLAAVGFLAPAAVAVVIGALSGAAAFVLALPHLPLADAAPAGPPADVPIPWWTALPLPLAALLVLVASALLVARAETIGLGRERAA